MTKKIIFGENDSNYESMQNQKDQQTDHIDSIFINKKIDSI